MNQQAQQLLARRVNQAEQMAAETPKIVIYMLIYELILQARAQTSGLTPVETAITVLINLHSNKALLIIRIHKIIMAAAVMLTSLKW